MEARGLAATTIDRRLSIVCGYYRFAHIDGRIASNPAQYVRRPKVYPNDARGLDRAELRGFLFAAERVDHTHAALAVLLGLNGLRVSEACSADIENLGFERGHRTLRIVGKGNKPAVIPLVPRTARTIDLAVGERTSGPILLRHDGSRLDRRTAHRWVRSIAKRAGIGAVHPHMLPGCVHHVRPGGRRSAEGGADRREARRSPHDDGLRPPPPELRSSRRLCGGRLRRRRLIYPGSHVGGERQPYATARRMAGRSG